jgi:hypothetical protein
LLQAPVGVGGESERRDVDWYVEEGKPDEGHNGAKLVSKHVPLHVGEGDILGHG